MQTTSLTIEWHNWGLCCGDDMVLEKTTVSKASGTIHITQSNGRREIILDKHIKAATDELQELFTLLDRVLDTGGWSPDYSVDVCDGFMWNMYIRRGKSKMIKVHGTVEPPPYGLEIESRIRKMLRNSEATIDPELFCACR